MELGISPSHGPQFVALRQTAPIEIPGALQRQAPGVGSSKNAPDELREAFDSFVGQTFYGQMLKSLREMNKPVPYFHGGQTEEIFRQQLDEVLAEKFSEATAGQFTGPMFDLFTLNRR